MNRSSFLCLRPPRPQRGWTEPALITADLLALVQSMLLTTEPGLHGAEPKTLRYRLLHVAARITRGQRKVSLRLAEHWP